jgi:hypothetical protein
MSKCDRLVGIALISFMIIGGLIATPAVADLPPDWLISGNYYVFQHYFRTIEPPVETSNFTYTVLITNVESGRVSYRETYATLNQSGGVNQIVVNTTFDETTRKIVEPARGDYYTWLWILPSDVSSGYAFLGEENFTLKMTTATVHVFESYQSSGNYSLLNFSTTSLRLTTGNGTVVWGNETSTFTILQSSAGKGMIIKKSQDLPTAGSSVGKPGILQQLRYSFSPPYYGGYAGGGKNHDESCYSYYYYAGFNAPTGYLAARSDAGACPPYGRVFSWASAGLVGPQAGSWRAYGTEPLLARFWYHFTYVQAMAMATCGFIGCGASSAAATLWSKVVDETIGWKIIASDQWVMFNRGNNFYLEWKDFYYNRDFPATLIVGHYYHFIIELDTDARAAVIGFATAFSWAQVQTNSQSVYFFTL